MAILQLDGESAQLRQVARSHAAGDLSKDDYRNIRTAMIESFVQDTARPRTLPGAAAAPQAAGDPPPRVDLLEGDSPWSFLTVLGAGAGALFAIAGAILLF
jgi:hypothetical protein